MSNQITEIRLLNVPLENDYKHTFFFHDKTEQYNYFVSKTIDYKTDLSYQRKDGFIRYPVHYDSLSNVNYIMYRNNSLHNWKYAFITEKKYINDALTDIYFETDVMQSYIGEYSIRPSFIEREHVDDDSIGLHTVPENLEVGEFVCEHRDSVTELANIDYIVGVTEVYEHDTTLTDGFGRFTGTFYNGIYSGVCYVPFKDIEELSNFIQTYADNGKNDAIQAIFIFPSALTNQMGEDYTDIFAKLIPSSTPHTLTKNFTRNQTYKNFETPIKNNKLYTFPYQYLLVSNNNGASAVYRFEDFTNPNRATFDIKSCITPGGSIRLLPKNYKGVEVNDEEGLNLGKFPICNWASDEYTNWLTQNSVNIALNLASGVGQIMAGGIGAATGIGTIASQLTQVYQMSFIPAQSRGNINCGDVITASGANTFIFQQMRIKEEYAHIIDDYFSMFGYKCNRVKIPNANHRENYWYTKTVDVNIDGAFSPKDLQTIKNCYNNGITFWKNPASIGDYSISNEIR